MQYSGDQSSRVPRWPLAFRQWQGARRYQEDALDVLEVDEPWTASRRAILMIVADGLGGAAGGAVASRTVTETFIREFARSDDATETRFRRCLERATAGLFQQEVMSPHLRGLGSTVVAVRYDGSRIDWLSVGDSPLWLFAGNRLIRLNADHSMAPLVEDLVRTGKLSVETARHDRRRHILESAVMSSPPPLIDCASRICNLEPGDFLLVATDGIETLSEQEIAKQLRTAAGSAETAADSLLAAIRAADNPGQDNVTFILLAGVANS